MGWAFQVSPQVDQEVQADLEDSHHQAFFASPPSGVAPPPLVASTYPLHSVCRNTADSMRRLFKICFKRLRFGIRLICTSSPSSNALLLHDVANIPPFAFVSSFSPPGSSGPGCWASPPPEGLGWLFSKWRRNNINMSSNPNWTETLKGYKSCLLTWKNKFPLIIFITMSAEVQKGNIIHLACG